MRNPRAPPTARCLPRRGLLEAASTSAKVPLGFGNQRRAGQVDREDDESGVGSATGQASGSMPSQANVEKVRMRKSSFKEEMPSRA